MIYLASPYSHSDPAVMQQRYEAMVQVVNHFYRQNIRVYSPIVHNHPVAVLGGLPRTWEFWEGIDLDMLARCDEFCVIQLPGWETSKGVAAELEFAKRYQIPVHFSVPSEIEAAVKT